MLYYFFLFITKYIKDHSTMSTYNSVYNLYYTKYTYNYVYISAILARGITIQHKQQNKLF